MFVNTCTHIWILIRVCMCVKYVLTHKISIYIHYKFIDRWMDAKCKCDYYSLIKMIMCCYISVFCVCHEWMCVWWRHESDNFCLSASPQTHTSHFILFLCIIVIIIFLCNVNMIVYVMPHATNTWMHYVTCDF